MVEVAAEGKPLPDGYRGAVRALRLLEDVGLVSISIDSKIGDKILRLNR